MNNSQETPITKCQTGRSKLDKTNLWLIKKRPKMGSRKQEARSVNSERNKFSRKEALAQDHLRGGSAKEVRRD